MAREVLNMKGYNSPKLHISLTGKCTQSATTHTI